MACH
ncbi:hypothetical protein E2C01_101228 [Portunus trituberculatus]